ncbi:MAG: TlpA family protein disulfide reductase [Acidobacteria bacterium]|nr:TlpA family protein disulfide reductase [Acidobacteriota bacterium]
MEPSAANREDAISRTLLLIGLVLVAGAILVYHYSPRFQPGAPAAAPTSVDGAVQPPAPVVPAIRGKPVAAFDLPDLNGKQFRPADFKGKVLLVNFWATWCAPCLLEIPWFLEFKERYGPEGLEILAISMDEEGPKVVKPFVEKHKMGPFTVVMGNEKTSELFGGLLGLPTTFMVDRQGNYYSKHQGLVGKGDVEEEIQILLRQDSNGKPAAAGTPTPKPDSISSDGQKS